jgi:hypothetical protein
MQRNVARLVERRRGVSRRRFLELCFAAIGGLSLLSLIGCGGSQGGGDGNGDGKKDNGGGGGGGY